MVENRDTLILYSAATCNLNCVYCAIDKNPALVAIDSLLKESFKGDYYINFCKEIFPDPQQLKRVEIWGGETFLGLDRILPTLRKIIEFYPNFKSFFVSSNMTLPNWIEQLDGVIRLLQSYGERSFEFDLQMSLDGNEEITDKNRGKGVTEKLTNNYINMLNYFTNNPLNNIFFKAHFKQTLTIEDIKTYLDTEEKIINYFKFFEYYLDIYHQSNIPNMFIGPTIPNTAAPSPHTKEDGILFKEFSKRCYEISQKQRRNSIFKYYGHVMPFSSKGNIVCTNCVTAGGMCGSGYNVVGLLPNDMISVCHSGFANFLEEYKKSAMKNENGVLDENVFKSSLPSSLIFHKSKLIKHEEQIGRFYKAGSTALINNLTAQIIMAASADQIDHRYIREDEAMKAANYIIMNSANCIRDNLAITGSITMLPIGLLRLLLNGARDYLDENMYS